MSPNYSPKIDLTTKHGRLKVFAFEIGRQSGLVTTSASIPETPFLRIHSSCVFSESLGAIDCDCARQLDAALRTTSEQGGLIIYLYQEGRGVGLIEKTKAISLQQSDGIDTAAAYEKLGHSSDPRSYDAAIEVLHDLGIRRVILGTSNPRKVDALRLADIDVVERVPIKIDSNELIDEYLANKTRALDLYED